MDMFPKKYNNKNLIKFHKSETDGIELYSPNTPLDQKINPGSLFSMYYKDMYCKIKGLDGQRLKNVSGYTVSSLYFSELDTNKSDSLKNQLPGKIQKNISFIKNLGLDVSEHEKSFVMTEKFNCYMRDVFSKLYLSKKLKKEQDFSFWSKTYQADVSSTNIIEKKVNSKKFTLKYFIGTKGQAVNIVTNRLETIFGDVAVLVNPDDKRYKKLIGQNLLIPIINKSIPIIGDETISSFCGDGTGIMRVTPGHDEDSLNLAIKHNLPTDVFAINIDGKFTENAGIFAGKDLSEFYDNIVKYVDDIGNVYSQSDIEEIRCFDKNTGEELYPMTLEHRTLEFDYAKDYLIEYIQNHEFGNIDIDVSSLVSKIESKEKLAISKTSSRGCLIPVVMNDKGDSFVLDENVIVNNYGNGKQKKDIVMTLIILDLILNNDLPSEFELQELIDILFSKNFLGSDTKLGEYLKYYSMKGNSNPLYKNGLKVIEKFIESLDKDPEKVYVLSDIIENSFAIQMDGEKISINYHDIFGVAGLSLQNSDSFSKNFIDYCRVLYSLGCEFSDKSYKEIQNEDRLCMLSKEELDYFIDVNLLGLQYSKRQLFSDIIWHPVLKDDRGLNISNYNSKFLSKDFYENFNVYGVDSMRLTTLFSDADDEILDSLIFNTFRSNEYNLVLTKIWNANRYVFSKYKDKYGDKVVKINDILNSINDNGISDYDNWMLHNLEITMDDFKYQVSEGKYLSLGKKLFENYVSQFCDKYINITKVLKMEMTQDVMLFVGLMYLELLYPYIPNFVANVKSKFGIDWENTSALGINNIELKEKNYKINILIEILDKIALLKDKLGMQRHEIVDVFVQANPDFLQFVKDNEHIFRLLTKIQSINLVRFNEELPSGYEMDNIINIFVGVKKPDKIEVEVKGDVLVDLEKEYKEKQEHLQHLKSLFTSIYTSAGADLVEKKRQEISDLQSQLDELEFKIGKLKMK